MPHGSDRGMLDAIASDRYEKRSEVGATTKTPVKGRQGHRFRRRTALTQHSTAMAVEYEGQVSEYAKADFENTDGNADENSANVSQSGHGRT